VTDAVWSYWSVPAGADHSARWATPLHHLLSWVLSVKLARPWFSRTALVTDDRGARLLVDALQLPFDEVQCDLDRIPPAFARWWALGKLHAYRTRPRPFVHLDSDVYLWSQLPRHLRAAPVLAQNPERFPFDASCYAPLALIDAVAGRGGWVPTELRWYAGLRGNEAACCGILGANDLEFIREYADRAIALVERNEETWADMSGETDYNVVVEQYLLSAFYYFHAGGARFHDVELAYLFAKESDAFDVRHATSAGFTHLMGPAKHDPTILSRVAQRVARDFPEDFERVTALVAREAADPSIGRATPCRRACVTGA
jgi:hypothetical protein